MSSRYPLILYDPEADALDIDLCEIENLSRTECYDNDVCVDYDKSGHAVSISVENARCAGLDKILRQVLSGQLVELPPEVPCIQPNDVDWIPEPDVCYGDSILWYNSVHDVLIINILKRDRPARVERVYDTELYYDERGDLYQARIRHAMKHGLEKILRALVIVDERKELLKELDKHLQQILEKLKQKGLY